MANSKVVWFGMKLSPEQKRLIKRLADREGTSAKEAVLRAVQKALAVEELPITPVPGSILDLTRDLAGSVHSTDMPHDLASNPSHMEGYGQ